MEKHHWFLVCGYFMSGQVMTPNKVLGEKIYQEQIGVRNCHSERRNFCPVFCESYVSLSINNTSGVCGSRWCGYPWRQGGIVKLFVVACHRAVMSSAFVTRDHHRNTLEGVTARRTHQRHFVLIKQSVALMRAKDVFPGAYFPSATTVLQVRRSASYRCMTESACSVNHVPQFLL